MKVNKYLCYFSYNGKFFSGTQIQKHATKYPTIQECIQEAFIKMFGKFLSTHSSRIRIASRTDSGVHAQKNCCDFFLDYPQEKLFLPPQSIIFGFNQYFYKNEYTIKFIDCFLVDEKFNCRNNPIEREYLYKIRLGKIEDDLFTDDNYWNIITEHKYYKKKFFPYLGMKFNYDKVREICEVFSEKQYNFSNFSKFDPTRVPVKKLEIKLSKFSDVSNDNIVEIHFSFKSKSFLRNQIRIILQYIIDYGFNLTDIELIKDYLELRKINLKKRLAPPSGLYLQNITYKENVFDFHNKQLELLNNK